MKATATPMTIRTTITPTTASVKVLLVVVEVGGGLTGTWEVVDGAVEDWEVVVEVVEV